MVATVIVDPANPSSFSTSPLAYPDPPSLIDTDDTFPPETITVADAPFQLSSSLFKRRTL